MFPLGIDSVVLIRKWNVGSSFTYRCYFFVVRVTVVVNDDKIKEKCKLHSRKLNTTRKICLNTPINQLFFSLLCMCSHRCNFDKNINTQLLIHCYAISDWFCIIFMNGKTRNGKIKTDFTCIYKQYYRIHFTESLQLTYKLAVRKVLFYRCWVYSSQFSCNFTAFCSFNFVCFVLNLPGMFRVMNY